MCGSARGMLRGQEELGGAGEATSGGKRGGGGGGQGDREGVTVVRCTRGVPLELPKIGWTERTERKLKAAFVKHQ